MVAILFEGKSDGKFFDDILQAYKLPIDEVVYFDFSHPNFNQLKQKLKNLFKEQK